MAGQASQLERRVLDVVDRVIELLLTVQTWVRQSLEEAMKEKVARPLIAALVFGTVAAVLLGSVAAFAVGCVVVGLVWLLGTWTGYPAALLIVGVLTVAVLVVPLVVMARRLRPDE